MSLGTWVQPGALVGALVALITVVRAGNDRLDDRVLHLDDRVHGLAGGLRPIIERRTDHDA